MADFVFNVATLLGQQPGAHRMEAVEAPLGVLDVAELTKPVLGTAQLTRIDAAILVSGHMRARVRVPCARCDHDLDVDIEFDLDDEFVPVVGEPPEADQDLADSWSLDVRHNLDLTDVLSEGVISAIPPFAVCDGGCEVSELDGQTSRPTRDPRLEPLEKIRKEMFPDGARDDG